MIFFRNSYSSFFFKISDTVKVPIPSFLACFSGLILVSIRQPVLNLFLFLTKVHFAYVLLGVNETFYRDQISVCMCVSVSMK